MNDNTFKPLEYGWTRLNEADEQPFCLLIGHTKDEEGNPYYLMKGIFKDKSVRTVAQKIGSGDTWVAPQTWKELGYD
jgi:hypothetical protein